MEVRGNIGSLGLGLGTVRQGGMMTRRTWRISAIGYFLMIVESFSNTLGLASIRAVQQEIAVAGHLWLRVAHLQGIDIITDVMLLLSREKGLMDNDILLSGQ